jgi:hypothetical protein
VGKLSVDTKCVDPCRVGTVGGTDCTDSDGDVRDALLAEG